MSPKEVARALDRGNWHGLARIQSKWDYRQWTECSIEYERLGNTPWYRHMVKIGLIKEDNDE